MASTKVWLAASFASVGAFMFGFDTGSIGSIIVMTQRCCCNDFDNIHDIWSIFCAGGVAGVGEGFFLPIIAVYCVEISPATSRGRVTSIIQIAVTVGIAAGFFCCYGTVHLDSSFAWRIPFLIQAFPRWLWMKGKRSKAEEVMQLLRKQGDNDDPHIEEWEVVGDDGEERSRIRDMFKKDVRKRTLLACFFMGMNQLSGIDGILYYAPVLFAQAGLSASSSKFLASGVSGLLNVAVTIVCTPFMDPSIYVAGAGSGGGRWVIIVCLYLFLVAFGSTWALTTRVYASEIQPLHNRAAVSSIANSCNQGVNTLVALTFPVFLDSTTTGPYWLFMGCLFTTSTIAWMYMPETKGRSLASIEQVFTRKAPRLNMVNVMNRRVAIAFKLR
ncbi:general substrate transporter [Lentinula edodes]|uniref:General substrate transporter n=1 Tax=Lentinula edodes TaxID=5353 RepID=A0A1Q3DWK6_LENED|nr:general substrate transporter [Lentinula edodes]